MNAAELRACVAELERLSGGGLALPSVLAERLDTLRTQLADAEAREERMRARLDKELYDRLELIESHEKKGCCSVGVSIGLASVAGQEYARRVATGVDAEPLRALVKAWRGLPRGNPYDQCADELEDALRKAGL